MEEFEAVREPLLHLAEEEAQQLAVRTTAFELISIGSVAVGEGWRRSEDHAPGAGGPMARMVPLPLR